MAPSEDGGEPGADGEPRVVEGERRPVDGRRGRVDGEPGSPDPGSRDDLRDFTVDVFTAGEMTHEVFRTGDGPSVVVLPELPGLTPAVAGLARRLRADGFSVAVPSLFGIPGRPVSLAYAAASIPRVCVRREFAAFAARADRPVASYVRALARDAHERAGGPGVGVVGLCFTGGFALAAAAEPSVLAPVASQPSVPFPVGGRRKRDLCMSDIEADEVAERTQREGLCLMGLRFTADRAVPAERFDALSDRFGGAFRRIETPSGPGTSISRTAHSVLGEHYVDEPGHPTRRAYEEVVDFLRQRLLS